MMGGRIAASGVLVMEFDALIRSGHIVDGTGIRRAYQADLGIRGNSIVAIGDLPEATAAQIVDATGKVVSPGFIDVHIHSEIELLGGEHRYASLLQGVTTQLLAPDGFGWAPLEPNQSRELWEATSAIYGPLEIEPAWGTAEEYLGIFAGNTPANVLPQVPHTAIRFAAMGWDPRPATEQEIEQMEVGVREWMEAGATCLCLGLDYQPSANSTTHELIELSKIAAEYDGIYTAHIRNTEYGRENAWRETMQIGREAGIPVHISHEHVTDTTERLLEEASTICDLSFESYMYQAGCTHLGLLLSIPLASGGPAGVRQRIKDPVERAAIRRHIERKLATDQSLGHWPVFANTPSGRWIGMSLFDAADQEHMSPVDFTMMVFDDEFPETLMIYRRNGSKSEDDEIFRRTFRHPRMMVASDGIYFGPHAHPRGYGCFARALRKGVRELQAVSIEEAVYKMTGFPAQRFRIKDRGQIAEGYAADIVIFDAETVSDHSTWEQPRLKPSGYDLVMVNGQVVIDKGEPTGVLPGQVLRGGAQ